MSKEILVLHLRIEQNGTVQHHFLNGKKPFYIGKNPQNDLPLIGQQFPNRHPLFVPKSNGYTMRFPAFVDGEIKAQNSTLRLSSLVEHDLLPRGNGYFSLDIKPGKMGYIFLDGARIDFAFENKTAPAPVEPFAGFDPWRVFLKSLREDALFKGVVTALILLNSAVIYNLRDYIPAPKERPALEQATQRLAKFVIKQPEQPPVPETRNINLAEETKTDANAAKAKGPKPKRSPKRSAAHQKAKNPSNLGVLALIGGTGQSNASNSVVDFLVSKDLAAGLNEVTSSKKLTVGRSGTGNSDDTADLLNSISSGNIDDIVGDIGSEVESVSLSKKGTVKVERLGSVKGSKEAVGARSEESLRDVLVQNMGRLTYIYNKYLKRNPEFRGELRLEVTIGQDGRVKNVIVLSSSMGNPNFEREIVAAVRHFRYDPISRGNVRVEYPIVFNKVM